MPPTAAADAGSPSPFSENGRRRGIAAQIAADLAEHRLGLDENCAATEMSAPLETCSRTS
jgi:hypothetical protein